MGIEQTIQQLAQTSDPYNELLIKEAEDLIDTASTIVQLFSEKEAN